MFLLGAQGEEEGASTVAGLSIYTERTQHPSSHSPSSMALTVGGKKPKQKRKTKKKHKIKQGSPEEEAALMEHLRQLRPDDGILEEISHLMTFLIYAGFVSDAQKLQKLLDEVLKRHASAMETVQISTAPGSVTRKSWKIDILRVVPPPHHDDSD